MPRRDPATAVLADPQVPESHRFCGACGEPVGRGRDGQAGPRSRASAHGTARRSRSCRSWQPGDAARQAVRDPRRPRPRRPGLDLPGPGPQHQRGRHGPLGGAQGPDQRRRPGRGRGRGRRTAVPGRGRPSEHRQDPRLHPAVRQEHRRSHRLHRHGVRRRPVAEGPGAGPPSARDGGSRRRQLPLWRRSSPTPSRSCPALGYLHDRGLLFCDFKPDNVIHAEDQLKLIDLGAVRRIDDQASALYGTPGYQAPELATLGPSVGSDLYTVGRTLAVLSFDFGGFSTKYAASLPDRADVPLLAQRGVVLPAARPGHARRPGPPVRLGRRPGRPAHRRAPGGAVGRRRRRPAGRLDELHRRARHVRVRRRRPAPAPRDRRGLAAATGRPDRPGRGSARDAERERSGRASSRRCRGSRRAASRSACGWSARTWTPATRTRPPRSWR